MEPVPAAVEVPDAEPAASANCSVLFGNFHFAGWSGSGETGSPLRVASSMQILATPTITPMKTVYPVAAIILCLLTSCDVKVDKDAPPSNTTVITPKEEKKVESNTTVVNPPKEEKKVENNTTIVNPKP